MDTPRLLKADEINCRVQQVTDKGGAIILLYKDARVDMNILDETYGAMNWQRSHELINGNLFCTISVWDDAKKTWVSKQDVGVESITEATKGEASDAFKRAGFNWGIGRELYTAPFVFVQLDDSETRRNSNGKLAANFNFKLTVSRIEYNEQREITTLVLVDKKGKVRFSTGAQSTPAARVEQPAPTMNAAAKQSLKLKRMTLIAADAAKYLGTKDKAKIRDSIAVAEEWMKANMRYNGASYEAMTVEEFAQYLKAMHEFYNPAGDKAVAV